MCEVYNCLQPEPFIAFLTECKSILGLFSTVQHNLDGTAVIVKPNVIIAEQPDVSVSVFVCELGNILLDFINRGLLESASSERDNFLLFTRFDSPRNYLYHVPQKRNRSADTGGPHRQ